MKGAMIQGAGNFYNPTAASRAGLSVAAGNLTADALPSFHIKSLYNFAAQPPDSSGLTAGLVTAKMWTTPSINYLIDYVSVTFLTSPLGNYLGGANFNHLEVAVNMDDTAGGFHSMLLNNGLAFSSTSYDITANRPIFSTLVDPGVMMSNYNLTGTPDGGIGNNNVFHCFGSKYQGRVIYVSFGLDTVTTWALSVNVRLDICGKYLA